MQISWWSKLWNWVYWIKASKAEQEIAQRGIETGYLSFSNLCDWMENDFKYKSDWPLIHWTQKPVITVLKWGGDCEDFAWLWYDQLTRLGYEPYTYKLYRRKWYTLGIKVWWHTITRVVVDWENWIFSNTRAKKVLLSEYIKDNGYCDWGRVK